MTQNRRARQWNEPSILEPLTTGQTCGTCRWRKGQTCRLRKTRGRWRTMGVSDGKTCRLWDPLVDDLDEMRAHAIRGHSVLGGAMPESADGCGTMHLQCKAAMERVGIPAGSRNDIYIRTS